MLVCVCAHAFTPLSPEEHHFVSVHADAGYSALLHTIAGQQPATGMNTNIGVDYRLYHNALLFSAGVEGMYELNANTLKAVDMYLPMRDTEGEVFNMHVLMDKSSDMSHMVNVNIPVLIGGEWNRFYFLVGPKIALNLYGSTSSNAVYTTYGEYQKYYDDFYDMPNHQFETNRRIESGLIDMRWNFNILAHAEIGGRIGHMYEHKVFHLHPERVRMYLAAYMDFGMLNLHSANKTELTTFGYRETDQGVQFYIQPLMLSSLAADAVFRNLNIGIKYTVAFEFEPPTKSFIYDWNKSGRDYRKRGGTQSLNF